MDRTILPARRLSGSLSVPADKSIAHRAAILAGIADGTSILREYPKGEDTLSTLRCLQQLGVEVTWRGSDVTVSGRGVRGLKPAREPLDCGNSGTTMRLLAGLLSAQPFDSILVGDASLQRRPMERIARPLRSMGAEIDLTDGKAPIRIRSGNRLHPADITLDIPSAQVKTAIILAALGVDSASRVVEPVRSRDHTERMLALAVESDNGIRNIRIDPLDRLEPLDLTIPGDFSSAAFFVAAASIVKDSELTIRGLGLNPTRTGMLDVLKAAGGRVEIHPSDTSAAEPWGDLTVSSTHLRALTVEPHIVPLLVDEVPVLAVTASQADGESRFMGIGELRAKESDRISATSALLRAMGYQVSASDDAMTLKGPVELKGAAVDSYGDHRIAMAAAVAGLVAVGETTVRNAEAASVSYPGFWDDLDSVTVR